MRMLLLILLAMFIPSTLYVQAEESISSEVENIDLHLKDHETAVTFFGLSTGESILVQASNGKNILINAGGKGTKAELDEWISLFDVKEISTLILTNQTEFNVEKINHLMSKYNIKEIFTTQDIKAELTNNLELTNQIPIQVWNVGTKKEILPELTAVVEFVGSGINEGMDLKLQLLNHTIFLMTSNSLQAEQMLMKRDLKDINVFKIPHVNKELAVSEQLIEYLNPEISILSELSDSTDTEVIRDLNEIWSEIYFTKKHGTVTLKFNENNYEVITIPVAFEE